MSERAGRARRLLGLLLCGGLLACTLPAAPAAEPVPIPIPTLLPPAAPPPAAATENPPSPTPIVPDTGWLPVAPGLEKRVVQIYEAGRAEPVEAAVVLRVDPAVYRFEVGYRPGQPQTLREWALESGGEIVINGGFFTPEWTATGLIIAGGEASGRSYGDFAGMVAIRDGRPEIRWLGAAPYDPAEPLDGALQAFPLLIRPGGVPGINADLERDTPDRRTAVAVDRSDRFLLIITPRGGLTLHAFSRFLAGADFDLEIALNLDGGTSSGLLWREGDQMTGIPAFTPLPAVLIAIRR